MEEIAMKLRSIVPRAALPRRGPRLNIRAGAGWAMATALFCSVLTARSASADAVLSYSDITLSARVELDLPVFIDTKVFPSGGPGLVSLVYEPRSWAPFPTSQSALHRGYLSAVMTTTGFAGLGVSGFQGRGGDARAFAVMEQTITNTGDRETGLFLEFTIPRLEASLIAPASFDPHGQLFGPLALAKFTTVQFHADGTLLTEQTVFDYELALRRTKSGFTAIEISPDLRAAAGAGIPIIEKGAVGIRYDPFVGEHALAILEPGERLRFVYELETVARNEPRFDEVGFQALVGDPFQVSGSGGIRITQRTVPEPSTFVILATGLIAVGAMRRYGRSGLDRRLLPGRFRGHC
jgi:hypothetical protein